MSEASTHALPPVPGATPPSTSSRSGCDKLLIGCGLGCGVLVLTFGVLAVVLGMWATRPGTQHETTAVVSPDGLAVMKLRDIGEDPGTQEFLTNFLRTMNEASREAQRQDLPENLRWLADMQGANDSPAGFNMFLPKDLTISLEPRDEAELASLRNPSEEDELAFVAAVNFRSFVRPIRWFITWVIEQEATTEVRHHGDHDLLPMGPDGWATFVDGTFVFSNSNAALLASLDRLDRGNVAREWSGEVPPGDWDFFGVVETGADSMDVVFRKVRDKNEREARKARDRKRDEGGDIEVDASEVPEISGAHMVQPPPVEPRQLAFGVDLKSADALDAQMVYAFDSDADAESYAAYLQEEMDQLRLRGEQEGLEVETAVVQNASSVSATLAVTGLEDKVAQMADWFVTMDDEAVEDIVREIEKDVEEKAREAEEAAGEADSN